MTISEKDVELIKRFIGIRDRGHYCDGTQLTEVYNRVLEKNVHVTNCGQCLRKRISELETALRRYEKELEAAKASGFTTVEEAMAESRKIMEEHEEEMKDANKESPQPTKRRKKK